MSTPIDPIAASNQAPPAPSRGQQNEPTAEERAQQAKAEQAQNPALAPASSQVDQPPPDPERGGNLDQVV